MRSAFGASAVLPAYTMVPSAMITVPCCTMGPRPGMSKLASMRVALLGQAVIVRLALLLVLLMTHSRATSGQILRMIGGPFRLLRVHASVAARSWLKPTKSCE